MAGLDEEKHEPDKTQLPQGDPRTLPVREEKTTCPERRRAKRNSPPATTWGVKILFELQGTGHRGCSEETVRDHARQGEVEGNP